MTDRPDGRHAAAGLPAAVTPDLLVELDRDGRLGRAVALSAWARDLPLGRLRGRRWSEVVAADTPELGTDWGDGPAPPLRCFEGRLRLPEAEEALVFFALPQAPGGVLVYGFGRDGSGLSFGHSAWAARQIREQILLAETEQRLRLEAEVLLASLRALLEEAGLQQICGRIIAEFARIIPHALGLVLQRQGDGSLAVTAASDGDCLGLVFRQRGDLLAAEQSVARLASLQAVLAAHDRRAAGLLARLGSTLGEAALVTRLQIRQETAFFLLIAQPDRPFPDRASLLLERLALIARHAFEGEERRRTIANLAKFASMGELMSIIAHEVNQPLTVISMAAENARMAIDRIETDEQRQAVKQRLRRVQQNVDKVGQIINSIRRLAHPGYDRQGVPRARLGQAISGVAEFMEGSLARSGVKLRVGRSGPDGYLAAHPVSLQQVLINLISNGRDAVVQALHDGRLQAEGWVAVDAEVDSEVGRARLRVSDNGGGIPEELRERVFERFFTSKESGKGSGLGLSIVQELVAEMGGRISVENSAAGAVFTLELPLAEATEAAVLGQAAGPAGEVGR
ncbi:hypothetical protein AY600_20095 [Phormidium willei BDU 130791]|nr:hypothetical protein AY600_20095 [Phormidium willei BDU 130791]